MSPRPLRVLVVTSLYPTPEDPGLGAFVAGQVQALRRLGLRVDVLFLDVRRSKLELLRGIFRVRRLARSGAYDLLHAHWGYNGIPACLQRRLPVVVSFCGTDVAARRFCALSRWVARRADAVIVKTPDLRRRLGVPAEVIPNGVDLATFLPMPVEEARRTLGLRSDGAYALFAANPARPEKRYPLALRAIEEARRAGAEVEPLLLHNRPHAEVPLWLNAADLLLLTSSREGSPNVVKEAMACNLPVVSTDVGDVRSLIGGASNCRIAEGDTPRAVARAIADVLRKGRSNGRDRVGGLSNEVVARRVARLYRRVLGKGGRP